MMRKIIPYLAIFLIGAVAGLWLCRMFHNGVPERIVEVQRDTLYVRDTISIEKPKMVRYEVRDTMYVAVRDTTRIHDTLYVSLPYEVKTYKGEDYYAEVSGYNPSLYYLEVYPKREVVTRTEKVYNRNELSLGMEIGHSTILYIPVYLQYDYAIRRNLGVYGRVFYDFPRMSWGLSVGTKVKVGW